MNDLKAAAAGMLRGLLRHHHHRPLPTTLGAESPLTPVLGLVSLAVGETPGPVTLPAQVRGRPLYAPLVAYGGARLGATLDPALSASPAGPDSALGVWWALALEASGTPTDIFAHLIRTQRPTGEFLTAPPTDSPDLHWYDELVILHALTTHAMWTGDKPALDACRRAAAFHTLETQPDHATSQPWAWHAFALSPETKPVADLLLHAAMANSAGELDPVSRFLLADALLALDRFDPA